MIHPQGPRGDEQSSSPVISYLFALSALLKQKARRYEDKRKGKDQEEADPPLVP
jgi:hypothetical protein